MTTRRPSAPSKPKGTPRKTLEQVPRAIKTISVLVDNPKDNLGKAMWNTGRLFAAAEPDEQWHLVDAAVTVAQTLRDTLVSLSGSPFPMMLPAEFYAQLPDPAAAGARAALVLLDADEEKRQQFRAPLLAGRMSGEAVIGTYLTACSLAHQCVLALAHGTGMTPLNAWKKARPLLMP